MSGRNLAIALGVLGLGIAGYALFARQTDEEKILEVLDRLETAVRVDEEGQNPLLRMAKVNQHFSEIFVEDVTFRIPEHTSANRGRKSIAGLAAQIGPYFNHLEIDFKNVTIDFEAENTKSRVASDAVADGVSRNGPFREERRVRFEMLKRDGDWQIQHLVVNPKGSTDADEEAEEDEETETQ